MHLESGISLHAAVRKCIRYTSTLTPFHSAGSNSVKPLPPILLFKPGEMDSKLSSCVKVIKSPIKQCQLRKAHGNFL